jgi:para-aminobenzoate synthetase component 2
MVLLIDNYDSFVYNLARYFGELGCRREVVRNDAVSVEQVRALAPRAIVLSPGPCTPREAGIAPALVRELYRDLPILGICLGHQCIGETFGWRLKRAIRPVHGKATVVHHDGRGLFEGAPAPLVGARYHSLVVEPTEPSALVVTARSDDGEVMGLAHRRYPTAGLQFHPESVLTEDGHHLLRNFLDCVDRWWSDGAANAVELAWGAHDRLV